MQMRSEEFTATNQELMKRQFDKMIKGLQDLKMHRDNLQEVIDKEELDKQILSRNVNVLNERINYIMSNLQHHYILREKYDTAIADIERSYEKILENSETLLNLVQNESDKLENVTSKKFFTNYNMMAYNSPAEE